MGSPEKSVRTSARVAYFFSAFLTVHFNSNGIVANKKASGENG
jgi:hypothetical protein